MPRYEQLWRNKWLTANAKSIKDMYLALEDAATELRKMEEDGLVLENPDPSDDYAYLVTDSPTIAEKWDLRDRASEEMEDGETYYDAIDELWDEEEELNDSRD